MNSRVLIFLGIAFAFLLAIDLYAFKGIRLITENSKTIYKQLSTTLFWLESIGIYMAIGWMVLNMDKFRDPAFTNTIFTINAFYTNVIDDKVSFQLFPRSR